MKISIFGLGYVGTVSFGCLTRDGHEVIGVDVDPNKLDLIQEGTTPVIEEGMDELISNAKESGRSRVTDDAGVAVHASDISFVCVGTPSSRRGDHDLTALETVMSQIGHAIAEKETHHVVVVRSTVAPGTTRKVLIPILEKASGKKCGQEFSACFQPEFLREGSSIRDYDYPPMTVVGCLNPRDADALHKLFGHLDCAFQRTNLESAEMLKFCCNTFHALKIGFANEVGRICAELGIDSREVMELLCMDKQLNISTVYLRPGMAFGGSCLPKDVRAIVQMSRETGVSLPIIGNIATSNQEHLTHTFDTVMATGQRKIGLLGLSFKSGTDDLRESPLVDLVERMIGKGLAVRIFDREVQLARLFGANKKFIEEAIPHISGLLVPTVDEIIDWAEVVVVGQIDSEGESHLKDKMNSGQKLIDLTGAIESDGLRCSYEGFLW